MFAPLTTPSESGTQGERVGDTPTLTVSSDPTSTVIQPSLKLPTQTGGLAGESSHR